MVRSIFGGFTDYSYQSFDDMVKDLEDWIENTSSDVEAISRKHKILVENGYWEKVDQDFQHLVSYAHKFFLTCLDELKEILNDIQIEVRVDHHKRLKALGTKAIQLNRDFGRVWHREYADKEYGNPHFRVVEKIYEDGRDRAVSLEDLSNLADRMEIFIGRKALRLPEASQIGEEFISAINSALWVLESEDRNGNPAKQGTGFMLKDKGIVTCSHVLSDKVIAFQAQNISEKYEARIVKKHSVLDLAILIVDGRSGTLEKGDSDSVKVFDPIVLAGFPNYRYGDSGVIKTGKVCGTRKKSGLTRFMLGTAIIAGCAAYYS